jgi:hypothetical protein
VVAADRSSGRLDFAAAWLHPHGLRLLQRRGQHDFGEQGCRTVPCVIPAVSLVVIAWVPKHAGTHQFTHLHYIEEFVTSEQ